MAKIECTKVSKKAFDDAKKLGRISTIKGQKFMLMRTNRGTGLIPVCIKRKK